ncbi:Group XV phospholipase A2 [Nymphon striatum]|nr:Group XV phospholipase A2 [Nymphon striatum]
MVISLVFRELCLFPGDGGSRILAKLDKPRTSHFWCDKKTENYFTLWLNIKELLPYSVQCLVDNMRLHYNKITRKTRNTIGVHTKIPGFGDTSGIEYLDTDHLVSAGHYYASTVNVLLKEGFKRGSTIRGAPYDFRKAPSYNFGNYFLNPLSVRPEQRTNPSLAFFLPSQQYWSDSEILVKTSEKQYTSADYKELFSDISWDTGYEMWLDTKDLISNMNPPGVEVHCLHGVGVKTPKM